MTAFSVWSLKSERQSPFNAKKSKASMPSHSDFRKFDDMLRLVLDCTPEQVANIRSYLSGLHQLGDVYFGMHESDHAIMTCLVGSTNDGGHIHFIDGGAGGYAITAKSLKEQMAAVHSHASAAV